jgi:hypothetical protein
VVRDTLSLDSQGVRMAGTYVTRQLPQRGARRRSEPVPIREVIAEIWAALEICQEEAREDQRVPDAEAMYAARSAS